MKNGNNQTAGTQSSISKTINKTVTLAIILIAASLMHQECNCKKLVLDCADTKYSFELPVRAYPDRDSISIGDTIGLR